MSDNPYSKYAYKRKRRRRSFVPLITIAVFAAVVLFTANLLFGFMTIGGVNSDSVTLRGASTWVLQSESFSTKAEASEFAYSVKQNGGAGFVMEVNSTWVAIENAYVTRADAEREQKQQYQVHEFSSAERKITLNNKSHKKAFIAVADSFIDNFELFNDYLNKIRIGSVTAAEVSNAALQNYNSLLIAVKELDGFQEGVSDPFYAKILLAANKELLALYLLSGNAESVNYQSDVAACICNIIFAYLELDSL